MSVQTAPLSRSAVVRARLTAHAAAEETVMTAEVTEPRCYVTRHTFDGPGGFGEHRHSEHQIIWAETGNVRVHVEGRLWPLAPGQAVVVPGDVPHDVTTVGPASTYSVYVPAAEAEWFWPSPLTLELSPLVSDLVRHLAVAPIGHPARAHAEELLLAMLPECVPPATTVPLPRDARARRVAEALLADPADPRDLRQWALELHISTKTLIRAFAAETGLTFSRWRTSVRMAAALPRLDAGQPVAAVAAATGYASTSGFTAAFREEFGESPARFARRQA